MIDACEIVRIGTLVKPHGIKGEMLALLDVDGLEIGDLSCLVIHVDGIPVPFFVNGVRQRGNSSVLLTIDGVADERGAARMCPSDIFAFKAEIPERDSSDEEGLYASDLIGYTAVGADGQPLGKVADIEDSTANVLFIIATPAGKTLYVPVVPEFISGIDADSEVMTLDLPPDMIDLNG